MTSSVHDHTTWTPPIGVYCEAGQHHTCAERVDPCSCRCHGPDVPPHLTALAHTRAALEHLRAAVGPLRALNAPDADAVGGLASALVDVEADVAWWANNTERRTR